eukprot:GFYU01005209.1.p1 GENE.GFYU01005209.1~~GFYU01005209.1.p1  ORF type:complete len:314 (-),score=49.01 GFYU01005209.1:61-864(-)
MSLTKVFSSVLRASQTSFKCHLPDHWMQGRTTYGGLSTAISLHAVMQEFSQLPPLKSALVTFIGPTGGDVHLENRILRQGKNVTYIESEVYNDESKDSLSTKSIFCFGNDKTSQYNESHVQVPRVSPPQHCPNYFDDGVFPAFTSNFEARLAHGGRPVSGSTESYHAVWVRFKDQDAHNVNPLGAVVAAADMLPPAIMPKFRTHAPVSSMTWSVDVIEPMPTTTDGWWLLETSVETARNGFSTQNMALWSHDMTLVLGSRQNVAIFQ